MNALAPTLAPYDVEKLRADFPILNEKPYGKKLVYLDNAASAQKPSAVISAMTQAMETSYANVHRGLHALSTTATEAYEAARFIGHYQSSLFAIFFSNLFCFNGIFKLKKMKLMKEDDIHYSPSLDFTNNNDNYSFCLSAITELDKLSFYIFYNRPIMKKVLFGLLGEKEKFDVIDKMFNENEAFDLLDKFIKKDYKFIENKMNQ